MHLDTLFKTAKADMTDALSHLDMTDCTSIAAYKNTQAEFLKTLDALHHLTLYSASDDLEAPPMQPEADTGEAVTDAPPADDAGGYPKIVTFERKLRGGMVQLETDVVEFLTEGDVRDMALKNGDKLQMYDRSGATGERFFKIHERIPAEVHVPELTAITQAIVAHDAVRGVPVVKHFMGARGKERLNYDAHGRTSIKIHRDDVKHYNLDTGDIIDIAYYNRPTNDIAKVRWKHPVEQPAQSPPKQKPTHYKAKGLSGDTDITPVFAGNQVAVFGAERHWQGYKEEITKRGGVLNTVQTDKAQVIEQAVKRSDVVILPVAESSHGMCEQAKQFAKQYDTPFVIMDSLGRTQFTQAVSDGLGVIVE